MDSNQELIHDPEFMEFYRQLKLVAPHIELVQDEAGEWIIKGIALKEQPHD